MRWTATRLASAVLVVTLAAGCRVPARVPAPASQSPSPMVERTRLHERLVQSVPAGVRRTVPGPGGRTVELLIPDDVPAGARLDVVVHFHGAAWLPQQAIAALGNGTVSAVVNLGAGSGVYHRTYAEASALDSLIAIVTRETAAVRGTPVSGRLVLSAFSAGHGAIRAILVHARHAARTDAVLLLDGMHTAYVPEGRPLADGGVLDTVNLVALTAFARAAARGEKRMIVSHSEIVPGSYASTTETADWMLGALGVRRTAVLRWGPRGMQQLGEARSGGFELLGFAGNSAPDHIDHLHAMPELLARVMPRP